MTFKNVKILNHPVLQHKTAILRDKTTPSLVFRQIVDEMTRLIGYEATRDLSLQPVELETPLEKTIAHKIVDPLVIVSIMRAGNAMLESLLELLPFASAGHIGIYRDKFIHSTVEYYFRLPQSIKGRDILLVDPILATGDTAVASINRLKQFEVGQIKLLNIFVAPEGIRRVHQFHPEVEIYAASLERELNERGYLLPGVGDAGDRLYQT